ncbi:MAG: hypothetical protein Q9187_007427, partial [Circinaria calcarea]
MSNYPPTPSFGGFGYNGHFAPPPPPGSNNMIHYPTYPQQRDVVYPHQRPLVPPSMSYGNAYAFNTNAQTTNPNFHVGGVHPPPSPAFQAYGQQHQNINVPQPPGPFPPMPIPNYPVVPQRLATSVAQVPSPSTLQPHTSLPPKPPPLSAQAQSLGQAGTRSEIMDGADREDGELSDGELHRPGQATHSSVSSSRSDLGRVGKAEAISDRIRNSGRDGIGIAAEGMAQSDFVKERVDGGSHVESLPVSKQNSISPHQNQDPSTNMLEGSGRRSSNQPLADHRIIDSPDEEISSVPQSSLLHSPSPNQAFVNGLRGDQSVLENPSSENSQAGYHTQQRLSGPDMEGKNKRECAKIVLQELYDNNIGFEKLLAEGIDASLLRELYLELGIAVPNLPLQQVDHRDTPNGISITKENQVGDVATSELIPIHVGQQSERTLEIQGQDTTGLTQGVKGQEVQHDQNALRDQNVVQPAQKTVNVGAVQEPSSTSKPNIANLPKKPPMATPGDKAIERKDYIAKMLAAKAGRNTSTAKASKPAEPSTLLVEVKNSDNTKENSRAASPVILTTDSMPVPLEKVTNTEDVRRAQTELARRKIEALKTRTEPHRDELPKVTQELPSSPLRSNLSSLSPPMQERSPNIPQRMSKEPPAPLRLPANEQSIPKPSATPQFTPSRSFFSSLGRRPANGIPGLFSFSAPVSPPVSQEQSIIPASSITSAIQAIPEQPTIHPLEQSTDQLGDAPIQQEDTDMDDIHVNSPIPVTASPVANSTSAPETAQGQSRKRPTAADFIESPADRIKRRLGSSEQIDVLIEISEDEDDSDKDEMDLDNVSTARVPPPPLSVAESAKAKAIRDLPPLSDFPSRAKSQVNSYASTPPMVQTPGKVKDQEILKLKEEQILLMQRKIAEMEQRKKAKQAISRAQTPGMSSPRQVEVNSDVDPRTASLDKGNRLDLNVQQSIKAADQQLEAQQAVLVAAEEALPEKQEAEARQKQELEELEERERHEREEREKQKGEQRAKALMLAKAESERVEARKAKMLEESQQRQKRKAELETALPELDVQLEKAKFQLEETQAGIENMKREITNIEREIERGLQGRQIILQQLDDIAKEEEKLTIGHQQSTDHTEKDFEATDSHIPVDPLAGANHVQIETNGVEKLSTEPSILSPSPKFQPSGHLPPTEKPLQHTETVDEIMDISSASSSSDEGEISDDSSRRISVERQVLAEFDQSQGKFGPDLKEDFMPDVMPAQVFYAGSSISTEDDQMMLARTPEPTELVPLANEEVNRPPDDSQMEEPHGKINTQDQAEVHDEVILDTESDSDDYEPPEPSSP